MNFRDTGIIIAKKALKETSFIISVFTEQHGIYSGVVSRASKKSAALYQVGNLVDFFWQARLHEHIGFAKCELIKSYGSLLISNRLKLYAFNSVISLIKVAFLEREPHNNFFPYLIEYMEKVSRGFDIQDYINLELRIITEAGYTLDLESCVVTGKTSDLVYVSPKSGRAVSSEAGASYASKLLPLPAFLKHSVPTAGIAKKDIEQALAITSYFLSRYIFTNNNETDARKSLIALLG